QRTGFRVGVAVDRGVCIDDPDDPAVHHRRVRVVVGGQPRGDQLHAMPRVPVEDDLRIGADRAGEDDVAFGVGGGEGQAVAPAPDRDPTGAGVGVFRAVGAVSARFGATADDGVIGISRGHHFTGVDPGLVDGNELVTGRAGGDLADRVDRIA